MLQQVCTCLLQAAVPIKSPPCDCWWHCALFLLNQPLPSLGRDLLASQMLATPLSVHDFNILLLIDVPSQLHTLCLCIWPSLYICPSRNVLVVYVLYYLALYVFRVGR